MRQKRPKIKLESLGFEPVTQFSGLYYSKKWHFQAYFSQHHVAPREWDQDSKWLLSMHFKEKMVPLSPNFAQRGNLPLKFGKFAKICLKIQNTHARFKPVLQESICCERRRH